jgi:hypothetical protein
VIQSAAHPAYICRQVYFPIPAASSTRWLKPGIITRGFCVGASPCVGSRDLACTGSRDAHRFGIAYYKSAKTGRGSAAVILAKEALGGAFWVATFCRDNSVLAPDDLRAFAWIREHTPPDAVV